ALARMAALVEPLPARDEARAAVLPAGDGLWRIELACRDRPGLLSSITAALGVAGLDVLDASIAGWPDGGVADAFTVRSETAPEPEGLVVQLRAARRQPPRALPLPDAVVTFDDQASPWHTLCKVVAPDRPGLLHALAVAFATSGADVHSARITTSGRMAEDHFELADGRGEKLGEEVEAAIGVAVRAGASTRARTKLARNRNNRVTNAKQPPRTVGSEDLANS
ncbi:MAG: ACT domain-containing protein, partial [Acidimicrobiales bacterium]